MLFSAAVYERRDHIVAEAATVDLVDGDDNENDIERIRLLRLSVDPIHDMVGCPGGARDGELY